MLQCVAVCCMALTKVSSRMCASKRETVYVCAKRTWEVQCVAVCFGVLQRVYVCLCKSSRERYTIWVDVFWTGLQHTATHCNTLQHTATYCNTHDFSQRYTVWVDVFRTGLQNPATHCNTHNVEQRYTLWVEVFRTGNFIVWFDCLARIHSKSSSEKGSKSSE